jgi:hypothetical protein
MVCLASHYNGAGIHFNPGTVMIEQLEERIAGVVCLHCGMPTSLSNSTFRGASGRVFAAAGRQISLVRCGGCGKEAPYLADEIVMLKDTSHTALYAA